MSEILAFEEQDIVKLILEFLENRDLCISMLSLERETGCVNGIFSEDIVFFRQLILDGHWDDAFDYLEPLQSLNLPSEFKQIQFLLLKHKYLELLCIKSEGINLSNSESVGFSVDELTSCLNQLEALCPNSEDYKRLCYLLSLPNISHDKEYQNWNPSINRINCFSSVYPILAPILRNQKDKTLNTCKISNKDRLVQLVIKGLFYEGCVEFCKTRASSPNAKIRFPPILDEAELTDVDLSLLWWLQALEGSEFTKPFVQQTLQIEPHPIKTPGLKSAWAEHIILEPAVQPLIFPYSHIGKRPNSARATAYLMSRSMAPGLDGLSLSMSRQANTDVNNTSGSGNNLNVERRGGPNGKVMAQSIAEFSLNSFYSNDKRPKTSNMKTMMSNDNTNPVLSKKMHKSIDHLFQDASQSGANDTFKSADVLRISSTLQLSQKDKIMQSIVEEQSPDDISLSPKASEPDITNLNEDSDTGPIGDLLWKFSKRYDEVKPATDQKDNGAVNLDPRKTAKSGPLKSSGVSEYHTPDGSPKPVKSMNLPKSSRSFGKSNSTYVSNESNINEPVANEPQGDTFNAGGNLNKENSKFVALTCLEDSQAIRAIAFHPYGNLYAVGSNSKALRICQFPNLNEIKDVHIPSSPNVVYKKPKHHRGSIYCIAWSLDGELIATGSNDKMLKLLRVDPETGCPDVESLEIELDTHKGIIRDLTFIQDNSKTNLLVSAGAGDCKIYVTDCQSGGTTLGTLAGHRGPIYSVYSIPNSHLLVSGSADKTARIWDLRSQAPVQIINHFNGENAEGGAFASVCTDPKGILLASGHEDNSISLFDIRGASALNVCRLHGGEVRSVRFSNNALCLLSGGYDGKIILSDLQHNLREPIPNVTIAEHKDKVIQCRWHPHEMAFISTSADRTAICWALPG